MNQPFFLVWTPLLNVPNYHHKSFENAKLESERLARQHKGAIFFILKSVGECTASDVTFTSHTDCPF